MLLAALFVAGCLIALTKWRSRLHAKQLAAKRSGMPPALLIDRLIAAGVSENVAEYAWDIIGPYYGEGDILPHPDDDLSDDAGIDPEDIEDMVAEFFRHFALPEPTRKQPEQIPLPLTILKFAQYLDRRRNELAMI